MDINEFIRTYFRLYYNLKPNKSIVIETIFGVDKLLNFEIIDDISVIKVWLNDKKNPEMQFFSLRNVKSLYEVFNLEKWN